MNPLHALFCLFLLVNCQAWSKAPKVNDLVRRIASDLVVEAPHDNEVCFSPQEPCDAKLWKFLQTAKSSIDVAIYDLTHDKLAHELLVASKKVKVRIVVDRRQSKGEHSLVPLLLKAGAQVRFGRQRGIMHHKFTIIDNSRLETGSFNYTNNAWKNNQENQIYLSTPSIVERFREQFETMWSDATPALTRK